MLTLIGMEKNKFITIDKERYFSPKKKDPPFAWADFFKPTEEEMRLLAAKLKVPVHELKKHYLRHGKRAGIVEIGGYSLITVHNPVAASHGHVKNVPISIFISKEGIITYSEYENNAIKRLHALPPDDLLHMFSTSSGFVVFNIVQSSVKDYFDMQENLEDQINSLEDRVFREQSRLAVQEVFKLKKTLLFMRKSLNSNREMVNYLQNGFAKQIPQKDLHYFRMIYSDWIELVDIVAVYSDILSSIIDTYTGSLSNKLNNIVKRITAIGSLLLIPTFFASVYGMNFVNFPEIHWQYGYAFFWAITIASVAIMLVLFRKYEWL